MSILIFMLSYVLLSTLNNDFTSYSTIRISARLNVTFTLISLVFPPLVPTRLLTWGRRREAEVVDILNQTDVHAVLPYLITLHRDAFICHMNMHVLDLLQTLRLHIYHYAHYCTFPF